MSKPYSSNCQAAGAIFEMGVVGPGSFTSLDVGRTATLDGNLEVNFGDAPKAGKTFLIIRGGDSLTDQFFHLVPVGLAPGGGLDLRDLGDCQYGVVFLEDAFLPVLSVDSFSTYIHMSSDRSDEFR